jgi:trk system potassium uptake protein TrkA
MSQFAVIGLGRFGTRLAEQLAAGGAEVIAIDENRELIEDMRDRVTLAVALDATDEDALKLQGIDRVDAAIVAIGRDFEANLLTTVTLKQLGVRRVISRAGTTLQGQILRRTGADEVVYPTHEAADRWTSRLLAPRLIDQIELAEGYSLVQLPAPDTWHDRTIAELNLRAKYHVNVVAIRRPNQNTGEEPIGEGNEPASRLVMPLPTTALKSDDTLIIIAADADIQKLPG